MLLGHARHEMSELETKQSWNAREFAGLEAKELREQVTDELWINLSSG